ncbi:type I restriction endonuclease subunit R [Salinicoccus halodurans]|uniref:Type I restriction enzyme endonuclease subunit n=1 Tax=Salinicoccus halodurans TaxID=407035 RepID=A0A0F7D4Y1_9STAP|nr:type I restriction endonuclease subunit R [Salinicoccus halodurans]AKG75025.1 restriction endonuclease subunit R [Salinicoccus halodurans]SFK64782.1 type I restriction enzyme, R subunit [Salinicoccus halodurans]
MGYQSEAALENQVMGQLGRQGFENVKLRSIDALINNFREILNERHTEKLNGKPLTDSEFDRLMTQISGKNVFTSAQILRDKFVLRRDDETELYLEFFNKDSWRKNTFQVTNQVAVSDKYEGRYDVTILINGLPVTQIELKRSGVAINEAFNQIERYRRDNFRGLFKYTQLFIVSNSQNTRYFANSDKQIYKSSMFYWSDEHNQTINNLSEFLADFCTPCRLSKMISHYMIMNETDHNLMIMRPYQVYATEALIEQALETNNNGYIWHTTGSGKTLTSFKASQLLAEQSEINKVIFLVDRKDLDAQTMAEFNKFQKDSVDLTDSTAKLEKQLADKSQPMIVTTIQKLNNAVKRNNEVMERYKTDKVIFIIDECHRSQFGDMHTQIAKHFTNAQFFGFTGTPRFEENRSQDGRATADIFGKCLHYYLIKDAIRDGNVLGFSVEYVNTFKGENPFLADGYVRGIEANKVWLADDRIDLVADYIYDIHSKKTVKKEYSAIFAVQSIEMAMKYYDAFKEREVDKGDKALKVATIFTYEANQDSRDGEIKESAKDQLARVIADYNKMYDTNFSLDSYDGYFNDISKRVKKGIKGEKIDVLIVVGMFLTGFDSKKLNTLYVDKNLKHHDLIQAYSRTNRVEKLNKPYGNIVNFRNLKKETDDAIKLFSQTEDTDTVIQKSYDEYLKEFKKALYSLKAIAPSPADANDIEREEDIKSFVEAFRRVSRVLLKLKTFIEFEFTVDELGIGEQEHQNYRSHYLDLYEEHIKKPDPEKASILEDIDFEIEIIRNDNITVSYIINLINDIDLVNKNNQKREIESIRNILDGADDEQLRLKSELIKEFLDTVVPTLGKGANVAAEYLDFEEEQKIRELREFAEENDYSQEQLNKLLSEYQYSGQVFRKDIEQGIEGSFLTRRKKIDLIQGYIKEVTAKYGV